MRPHPFLVVFASARTVENERVQPLLRKLSEHTRTNATPDDTPHANEHATKYMARLHRGKYAYIFRLNLGKEFEHGTEKTMVRQTV